MTFHDLHCHILPGMDDGAGDVTESLALVREEIRQGCEGLICTPHYYARESISSFLARRAESWETLQDALEENEPAFASRIALGAEVAYHNGLLYNDDLRELCLGKSGYLLLEMPFSDWTRTVLREVRELSRARGLKIIIAHLERYLDFVSQQALDELLDMQVIVQMNAGELLSRTGKKTALTMVNQGITEVLSSDTHNMTLRPPTMADGLAVLEKNHLSGAAEEILRTNAHIFKKALGE